jgi:uncharacterized membrane protein YhaH (DUF805 family)
MFKNPFSFEGRIRRTEFGLSFLIYLVAYFSAIGLVIAAGNVGTIFAAVIFIPVVWFLWAQGAKRCHDLDRSGWFQLIPFYVFIMLFQDGEAGMNRFGANPKGIPGFNDQMYMNMDSETLDGHMRS